MGWPGTALVREGRNGIGRALHGMERHGVAWEGTTRHMTAFDGMKGQRRAWKGKGLQVLKGIINARKRYRTA